MVRTAKVYTDEIIAGEAKEAATRIGKYVRKTPLENSAYFSQKTGANVFLKLECEQVTGSLKARAACNKIFKLAEEQDVKTQDSKIFTASCGNHGLAMAFGLKIVGKKGVIYVSTNITKSKEEDLLFHGAKLQKFGVDIVEAEKEAIRAAKEENGIFFSPYNDPDIIAANGTIALEILQDCKNIDAIFVTVGGGGVISGISSYAKHVNPKIQIIGCSPVNSNAMEQSVKVGKQIDIEHKDTLSDGSAGNVHIPSMTFPICQRNVDRWMNVTEKEIADAIFVMLDIHHKVIEGAAGVALASFLKVKDDYQGQNVAILICGSSIDTESLKTIINART